MKHKKKAKGYLFTTADRHLPDLCETVAEKEQALLSYYVDRERYVDRALNFVDPATFFVGPKGVGKSAILQMVRIIKQADERRIVNISPDDLAFSALANVQAATPLIAEADRNQWLFKSLWDYVLSVEILRREFGNQTGFLSAICGLFRGQAEKEARKLLNLSLSDDGVQHSLTDRVLQLVREVELAAEAGGASVSAKAKLDASRLKNGGQLKLLSLVNAVSKGLGDCLKNEYIVLIDDLDLHWLGTPLQNAFIAALFLSLRKMSRPNLKFVVAVREQIFRELPLEDRDKFRPSVCDVAWDESTLKKMVQKRLAFALHCREDEVWGGVFESDVFTRLVEHTNGIPRELIRLAQLCIDEGRKRSRKCVQEADVAAAVRRFSDERIDDLESAWAYKYRGLNLLVRRFNGWHKEFPVAELASLSIELGIDLDDRKNNAEKYAWVAGYYDDAVAFAQVLLETGVVMLKFSRTDHPRPYDSKSGQEIPKDAWLSFHPMYAPALGLVGA